MQLEVTVSPAVASLCAFLRPGNYPEICVSANEGVGLGALWCSPALHNGTAAAAEGDETLQCSDKHIACGMANRGRGGKDGSYRGMPLVMMSRAGSGNVGGAGAASSVGAVGTGSQGQHWERPRSQALLGPALVGIAEPAPRVPILGASSTNWEKGPRQGLRALGVPGSRPGAAELPPPGLAAAVGWDGGCFGIRSGSGGAE